MGFNPKEFLKNPLEYEDKASESGGLLKDSQRNTIIIKRYQNRKLYDTQNSVYVTLDDISRIIRRGDDVRIISNRNKEDLTSITLTQIIFEEEKRKKSLLPLTTLKNVIRNGGGVIRGLVSTATDSVQSTLHSAREGVETIRDKLEEAFLLKEDYSQDRYVKDEVSVASLQNEVRKLRQKILYLEKKLRVYEQR